MKFDFTTDAKSRAFCKTIATEMVGLFGIPLDEAVGRINRHWKGQSFVGEDEMIYHETEDFWAKEIYFERWPQWWTVSNPKPRPYP